ncbi:sugar ABC transporter permease [Arsenicicoccus piscis]|uniref:ABC transporter permease n=1 Tax=Arsenicicoccus piscis TaxID=673954 RepID=A0ABQ6HTN1_9MICO|nr:sugar ABC transporter permease [Arsenicicoccus piscis]MCH8627367.1 sugar ABC transporter permease [Arsenicicoccus piscis]GMA21517.1 ABC transporter permease [Arsenicicoccus piscis]GMA22164.1 ABC transporter permease [Arsenicicoccus piscis]GMA22212.1 ABC transporter permease [Arsenicicoccus piscis]
MSAVPQIAPAPGASTTRRKKRERPRTTGGWLPYLLIAPAVIFELAIHLIPMAVGVWMSFIQLTKFFIRNWSAAPFVGLKNYRVAVDFNGIVGQRLLQSFLVTCAFSALAVLFAWALGMLAAVVLQKEFKGRAFFRTLFLVPYALPAYAGIITWNFMLQRDTGLVNHILVDQLHLTDTRPFWLIGNNAFVSLVVVAIWRLWPFAFLTIMAGLQSIPQDVYEAAEVDGARPLKAWRMITLPMLRPVNTVLIFVLFLWTFCDFNTPFVLFGSAQPPAGDLISFHIYNASFLTWNFGSGAAMSCLLLIFLMIVTGLYLALTNRRSANA